MSSEIGKWFHSLMPKPSLSIVKMLEIRRNAAQVAQEMDLKEGGYFYVTGRHGLVRLRRKIGDNVPPMFRDIAQQKLRTARRRYKSTHIFGEGMKKRGLTPADYGRVNPNIVAGGVPIFKDGQMVGAAAFSGGDPLSQDFEICRRAVEKAGLHID